ncbi:unnamed protein product [Phytomonas sp. EM1]|nr:unnamed protein product [Phytomonas sp. EM1]|eukprot:CCW61920.1 unnamed protein product [Phytomonas sp. isolate EM1]
MPLKKKKKVKEPKLKLVAPEPPGDEWETNWVWDHISAEPHRLSQMNGTHVAATEGLFNVEWDLREASPRELHDKDRVPPYERITDAFAKTQDLLRSAQETVRAERELLGDFEGLTKAEKAHADEIRIRYGNELAALLDQLAELHQSVQEELTSSGEELLARMREASGRVCELAARDQEIGASFTERIARLEECERVKDAYYTEHQQYIRENRKLKEETNIIHSKEVENMVETLGRTTNELAASLFTGPSGLCINSSSGKGSWEETPATGEKCPEYLLKELIKLNLESSTARERQAEAIRNKISLRRRVNMEKQQLFAAKSRNEMLKKQLEALKKNSRQPSPPNWREETVGGGGGMPCGVETSAINRLAEARRQLNHTTKELSEAEATLDQLRRYHFSQLSGSYNPTRAAGEEIPAVQRTQLDPTISAAVRQVVMEATIELNDALMAAFETPDHVKEGEPLVLEGLQSIGSLRKRRTIQNYVVKRINNLFTCKSLVLPLLSPASRTTM